MPELFADARGRHPGLALFLNAGDPTFAETHRLALALDDLGVDCLELAVPFPNSVTDGVVVRRSATRAIAAGADLTTTLAFLAALRSRLAHMRVVLMVDWRYSVRALQPEEFVARVQEAGCDGLLLHGAPPRVRPAHAAAAHAAGVPLVSTCYVNSSAATMRGAAANATAYLYLVSHYGRGGEGSGPDRRRLEPAIAALRALTAAPIAVGFGVRTAADVRVAWDSGADAAIVGSAGVARVERALRARRDPVAELSDYVLGLRDAALTVGA